MKQDTCSRHGATAPHRILQTFYMQHQLTNTDINCKRCLDFSMDDKSCVMMFKTILDMRQTSNTRQRHLDIVSDSHGQDCSRSYSSMPECSSEQLTMNPDGLLQQSQEVLQRKIVCWEHSAPEGWTGICSSIRRDPDTAVGKLVVQRDGGQFTEHRRQQQQVVQDSNAICEFPSAMSYRDEQPDMRRSAHGILLDANRAEDSALLAKQPT